MKLQLLIKSKLLKLKTVLAFKFSGVIFIMLINVTVVPTKSDSDVCFVYNC